MISWFNISIIIRTWTEDKSFTIQYEKRLLVTRVNQILFLIFFHLLVCSVDINAERLACEHIVLQHIWFLLITFCEKFTFHLEFIPKEENILIWCVKEIENRSFLSSIKHDETMNFISPFLRKLTSLKYGSHSSFYSKIAKFINHHIT